MGGMHHYNFSEPEPRTSIVLGLFTCILIIAAAAALGKAMVNLQAALVSKPDVGIYMLLPDLQLGDTELIRDMQTTRDYYAESKEGPLLVHMVKPEGETEWRVSSYERLRPSAAGAMHS